MSKSTKDKHRNEIKYLCTREQMQVIRERINQILDLDSNVNGNEIYTVRSLYFDDFYDRCLRENINGVTPREKFRVRIYNGNSDKITLELKKKIKDKTIKKACPISQEQCRTLMQGEVPYGISENQQLLRKLGILMETTLMKPKVIVEYDRIPYVYELGNVRVTFDLNVSSCNQIESFLDEELCRRPVMSQNQLILEVKYDEYIPRFVYNALQLTDLKHTAFSKYYYCRRY